MTRRVKVCLVGKVSWKGLEIKITLMRFLNKMTLFKEKQKTMEKKKANVTAIKANVAAIRLFLTNTK